MTDSEPDTPAQQYQRTRERLGTLLGAVAVEDLARPVPACPGWRVGDVPAHLVGVLEDFLGGTMPGADFAAWTQAQVDRRAGRSLTAILGDWADLSARLDELPPPMHDIFRRDVLVHEHDVRGALARPGARDTAEVTDAAVAFVGSIGDRLDQADLGAVDFVTPTSTARAGTGAPAVTCTVPSDWELLRGLAGRRTRDQLAAWDWSEDPGARLDHLAIFAPPTRPLDE